MRREAGTTKINGWDAPHRRSMTVPGADSTGFGDRIPILGVHGDGPGRPGVPIKAWLRWPQSPGPRSPVLHRGDP